MSQPAPTTNPRRLEAVPEAAEPKPKKKRRKLLLVLVLFILAVGAAGVAYKMKLLPIKPHAGAKVPPPPGPVVALPQVTTNLSDGHIIQIDLSIQLESGASSSLLKGDNPKLENLIISTLGQWSFSQLLPASGRAEMEAELQARIIALLGDWDGHALVTRVYTTGLLMQ